MHGGEKADLVKIKTENSYIAVANVYISPNQTIDIDKLSAIFLPKTIIVGDLNAKTLSGVALLMITEV